MLGSTPRDSRREKGGQRNWGLGFAVGGQDMFGVIGIVGWIEACSGRALAMSGVLAVAFACRALDSRRERVFAPVKP